MGVDSGLGIPFPEWSPEKSLKFMKKNKITHAVVSTGIPVTDLAVLKELTRLCNTYTKELKEEYPHTFGGFSTLPLPDVPGAITELKYALDNLKLDGVAFFTHYNGKYLGCKEFDEVFKELNSRKAVVLIHPIDPPIEYDSRLTMPNALIEAPFETTRANFSRVLGLEECSKISYFLFNWQLFAIQIFICTRLLINEVK